MKTTRRADKPTVWTDEDIRGVLDELEGHGNPAHHLITRLMLATGLRIGEVLTGHDKDDPLRAGNIDPERGSLNVKNGKGERDRVTYFVDGGPESPTLEDLRERIQREGLEADDPIFSVGYMGYYQALRAAAEDSGRQRIWKPAGTNGRTDSIRVIRPHGARHTWVRLAREAGVAWEDIALMGWGSAEALPTVMEWYAHVDLERRLLGQVNGYRLPTPAGPTGDPPQCGSP